MKAELDIDICDHTDPSLGKTLHWAQCYKVDDEPNISFSVFTILTSDVQGVLVTEHIDAPYALYYLVGSSGHSPNHWDDFLRDFILR